MTRLPSPRTPSETFRARVHDMLRTSILDSAWTRAAKVPWSQVRIADIAEDVGVSRQTIHNEFGTKDQLAEALFEREMHVFLQGDRGPVQGRERRALHPVLTVRSDFIVVPWSGPSWRSSAAR